MQVECPQPPTPKKIQDLVLQDKWVTIRQIVEDAGLSQYMVHNIIIAELSARQLLMDTHKKAQKTFAVTF